MYINSSVHMPKTVAMPIYGKNLSKISFSENAGPISTKLGMKHLLLKYYNVYINHVPPMTLAYFMASQVWKHRILLGKK